LTAKVIPDDGSFSVAVSVHWEGEYAPFTLTAIVDLYAVTAVGAPFAVPIENAEARINTTNKVASKPGNFDLVTNFALVRRPSQRT
jgi:hypothetical protein